MSPPGGRLVVCPTPIGNLDDITLRVLAALREADVLACEDTRHTRGLLARHGIERGGLVSLHQHNERSRGPELVERMRSGETVALVSDAGMPGVSDPGVDLVRRCAEAGIPVEVLPGPSAAVTALVASGLPAERWTFVGFLPRRAGELRELWSSARETVVAYESPNRVGASLRSLAELDPSRPAAVCRELTKLHEEVARGTAAELAERFSGEVRGEVVLVVGAAPAGSGDEDAALEALRAVVAAGARARPAAGALARLTGVGANALYRRAQVEREEG